jgi:hypothetical protein
MKGGNKMNYIFESIKRELGEDSIGWREISKLLDAQPKKEEVGFKTEFKGECYIIQDATGNFVYGECEGEGMDFEQAQKFNDFNGALRFVNHNEEYDSDHWKIFKVKIDYEILV